MPIKLGSLSFIEKRQLKLKVFYPCQKNIVERSVLINLARKVNISAC